MERFKVRGESTVTWELELEIEGDYLDAGGFAQAFVQDMIQLDPAGAIKKAEITGQADRVLRVREVVAPACRCSHENHSHDYCTGNNCTMEVS